MFKKNMVLLVVLSLVLAVTLSACSEGVFGMNVIRGSGKVVSETRTVDNFTGINLFGSGKLTIIKGETPSLKIEADDNILPYLTSDVKNGTLELGTKPNVSFSLSRSVYYTLTTPSFNSVVLFGSGDVKAQDFTFNTLAVRIDGSGDVTLSGTADSQDVNISGSGTYHAEKLVSQKAKADVFGSGSIYLSVSDDLAASIFGSGSVYYSGKPSLTQKRFGSGKIIQR